jgi:Na+:H+ antiporter, NhaA family
MIVFRVRLRRSTLAVTGRLSKVVKQLLRDEASSGKFLLAAVAIALVFMNSPFAASFEGFWNQTLTISIGSWGISETLRHWIDEGLMAIFFLVAGLEIKREIVKGELRTFRAASLPIFAAIGGMVIPALIYMAFNIGYPGVQGWGVPMTTDIAIAVGVLALLGDRVPASLRLFLLTLAVVDDIGAIIVIALFYSQTVDFTALWVAAALLMTTGVLQWLRLLRFSVFVAIGVGLWLAFHASGIHAAIAGALLGLSAPIVSRRKDKRAIAGHLERTLIPISAFLVVPLFALANAGVTFGLHQFDEPGAVQVGLGVIAGLVIGKMVGIVGATFLVVHLSSARLPRQLNWRYMVGVGLLAGIGFTMSIFIAELAFTSHVLNEAVKMSIFTASLLSATFGLVFLLWASNHDKKSIFNQ